MTQPYYNVMCVMKGVVIMTYGPIAQQYMMPHTNAGHHVVGDEIHLFVVIRKRINYIPALWAGDVIFDI